MSEEAQKRIFTRNLNSYIEASGKTQLEIAKSIGVSPQTFNTWCKGIAIPRMGKVQALADYFHINKSDLIEDKSNSNEEETYYLDDAARDMAQFMYENPEYKVLFDASRKVKKEDIDFVKQMIDRMSNK
ncbi:MAG: helix-turn-helix transcriptional regulator [Eubacteriales bacterium]|nr:helix-turn-helix transcriptional regulator [Eubacteriales bacterium]